MTQLGSYQLNLAKGMQEIFYNARKAIEGKGFRGMNADPTLCSRKAAKLAKKNNEINFLKKLRVFAPLRETFSIPVYQGWGYSEIPGHRVMGSVDRTTCIPASENRSKAASAGSV